MTLIQRIAKRSKSVSQNVVASMAAPQHARTQGRCAHCKRETPWAARPLRGFFRCLRCGNNPFNAPHREDEAQ